LKRILSIILCLLFALGCAQKKGDPNTITVWHWMTDRNDAFQVLAQKYEAQTGVKVKIDLFAPSDAYTQKVTASTQANILPDKTPFI